MKILLLTVLMSGLFLGSEMFAFELQGFEVEAGAEIPLQIGARAKLQIAENFHGRFGLGYIPDFFAETYGDFSGSAGIHGSNTGSALGKALAGAFTVDARVGYSADPDGGIYFEGGYLFIAGGSGSINGNIAEDAIAIEYTGLEGNDDVTIDGSFHALSLHVGYLLLLSERLSLNFDVGMVKPLISDVGVSVSGVSAAVEDEFNEEFGAYLEEAVSSEMFIPTASVFISYLF